MKKNLLLTVCFSLMMSLGISAESIQTLTIDGQPVNKVVTQITFDGDNVVLNFSDASSQTADMNTVNLAFSQATGIDAANTFQYSGIVGDVITLGGITAGTQINIFDAMGKQQFATKAKDTSVQISVSALQKGIYLIKAGKQVIKFVKR